MFGKLHLIATVVLFLLGCAAQPPVRQVPVTEKYPPRVPQVPEVERGPFQTLPERFGLKALEFEKSEELSKALFCWKVVHSFTPHDPAVSEKIRALEARIRKESESHFLKGLERFHKNQTQEARKEFLLSLAYNPEHKQALDYLKHKLYEPDQLLYETKEGDTPRRISETIYQDPEKRFLIAYFNDIGPNDPLKPGMTLKLPMISSIWMVIKPSYPEMVIKPSYPEKVSKPSYTEKTPDKPSPPQRQKKTETQLRDQAEVHYIKGVNYFLAEELEKAIREWEETLRLNPDHPKVRRDLEKARRLLKSLMRLP